MGCCQSKTKEKKAKEDAKKAEAKKQEEKPKPQPKPEPQPEPVAKQATPEDQPREVEEPAAAEESPVEEVPLDPRQERIHAIRAHQESCPYHYDACTVEGGDVKAYFENGTIYRIIKDDSWFIYNDSLDYEASVDFRFGPGSAISAGERTTLEETEDGWICAHAVVHPLETLHYISGTVNGYKSGISIKPITAEYRHEISEAANNTAAQETAAVRALVGDETDDEAVLRRCVAAGVPYVDLRFPPQAASMARPDVDVRNMPEMAFMRPSQYLPESQRQSADAIVGPVVSQSIDAGNLGDSWLMCAAAAMAEEASAVEGVFAIGAPAEKALGAYRVSMNKNGWWESVIVDDYLPTVNKMPVFARSSDNPSELWVSLLEKAYAKVHGSYASVTGGDSLQALTDFTGSPVFRFDNDWASAAINAAKADEFIAMLVEATRSGAATVVLNTPSHGAETYLGRESQADPQAFREKYAAVGLHTGYTYFVERVVSVKKHRTLLFKVRNPWRVSGTWTGMWGYGSSAWEENPEVCAVCDGQTDPKDGSFWIDFEDAKKYFDGGGVIVAMANSTDYRVKGVFEDDIPSAVLDITAAEPVRVLLTLSQPDKRGVDRRSPPSRFAPIMLTLAKQDGDTQQVVQNTSWNPLRPADEFNFVVGRDVAMWATLQPGERYQVVPRIHRKGVKEGYDRPYVIGIIAEGPLEGKVHVEAKHIPAESNVFTNYAAYAATSLASVDVHHQTHTAGAPVQCAVSSTVVSAAAPAAPAAEVAEPEEQAEEQAEAREAKLPTPQEKTPTSPVQSEAGASIDEIQQPANVPAAADSDADSEL